MNPPKLLYLGPSPLTLLSPDASSDGRLLFRLVDEGGRLRNALVLSPCSRNAQDTREEVTRRTLCLYHHLIARHLLSVVRRCQFTLL